MALQSARYRKHRQDAVKPGVLSVASDFTTGTTPLVVTAPAPDEGWVVVPIIFYMICEVQPARGIGGINPVQTLDELLAIDDRYAIIERIDGAGTPITTVLTPMERPHDLCKFYRTEISVAALVDQINLDNTGLRVTFNGKHENERQYALINYRIVEAETQVTV